MRDLLVDGLGRHRRRRAGDTRFRRDQVNDLIERRCRTSGRRLHRRFDRPRRRGFGDGDLVAARVFRPGRDVALGFAMTRRGAVRGALVGCDLPVGRAGIAIAEEKLGQGEWRTESLKHTVVDADGRAAMATDDDLRLRRGGEQGTQASERNQISAAAEGPLTATLKASRKAKGHQI